MTVCLSFMFMIAFPKIEDNQQKKLRKKMEEEGR